MGTLIYAKMVIYSIPFKLEFSLYSEVKYGSTTFELTEGWQRLKKNDQLFNLIVVFFHFLYSNVPNNKCQTEVAHAIAGLCAYSCTH